MYVPSTFSWAEGDGVVAMIAAYPFATLITPAAALHISHIPVRFDRESRRLLFHLAAANPHAAALASGAETTAVFLGPHGYVSPRWYGSRDNVPTWNYQAVHVTGAPKALDEAATLNELAALAACFESGTAPWTLADLSKLNRDRLLAALRAFEMPIARLEAKAKLSQNRGKDDIERVIAALAERDTPDSRALAEAMRSA